MKSAHLLVLPPNAEPRWVEISGPLTIGSALQSSIRVTGMDEDVIAAEITARPTGHVIVRRGGVVMVNAKRVKEHALKPGDLIQIGDAAFSYRRGHVTKDAERKPSESEAIEICTRLLAFSRRVATGDESGLLRAELLRDLVDLTHADRGVLVLREQDQFRSAAVKTSAIGAFGDEEMTVSRTMLARVFEERRAVLIGDTAEDTDLALAPSLHDANVRSIICAPIFHGDRLLGALYLSRTQTPGAFSQRDLDLLVVYAAQAAFVLGSHEEKRASLARAERAEKRLDTIVQNPIIGNSRAMRGLLRDLKKIAKTGLSVVLLGETGTGKELFARELHRLSDRADGPFVAINCGAIPAELIESELFGHARGAFTDARDTRSGLIRSADGGTLFLDEIGEMPLPQQAKLLRVLEERKVQPVGDEKKYPVDFRLLCATHADLTARMEAKTFRQDLYFRIAGTTLLIPPLREREDDVIILAQHFLRRHASSMSRPEMQFSASALTAIRRCRWEGNVRELEAAIRRAVVMTEGDLVGAEALDLPRAVDPELDEIQPLERMRDEFLKRTIRKTVEAFGGNRTAAARALEVTPRTIFKYLEEV